MPWRTRAPHTLRRLSLRMAALPLVGGGLTRRNPRTDRFACSEFDHIEFWCCDASSAWRRFALGLGLQLVAKSDQSTGNAAYASYVCRRARGGGVAPRRRADRLSQLQRARLRIHRAVRRRGRRRGRRGAAAAPRLRRGAMRGPRAPPPLTRARVQAAAHAFAAAHGLAVRAVGLLVEDARAAHAVRRPPRSTSSLTLARRLRWTAAPSASSRPPR